MSLLPDCREVHRMVIASQDSPLPLLQRVRLRLHLGICSACTNFRRQIGFIRLAMRRLDGSGKSSQSGAQD